VEFQDSPVAVLPENPFLQHGISGVVGFGLLADMMWVLDGPRNQMILVHKRHIGDFEKQLGSSMPMTWDNGVLATDITLKGKDREEQRKVIIDCGHTAQPPFLVPTAWAWRRDPPAMSISTTVITAAGEVIVPIAFLDGDLWLGDERYAEPVVGFMAREDYAIVGREELKKFVLIFDAVRGRLWIRREGVEFRDNSVPPGRAGG
jgi:hypothetical protein